MESREGTLRRVARIWHERTRRPLDERTAWACFIANQLLWPGLGGAALREVDGFLQMLMSLGAGVVAIVAGVRVISAVIGGQMGEELWPLWRQMVQGLVVFGLSWLWSLWSSFRLLREARSGRL